MRPDSAHGREGCETSEGKERWRRRMGRAHHDGQELEHLPERRLGEEQPSERRQREKTRACLFGFGKYMRIKSSAPPPSLFLLPRVITRAAVSHCRRHMPLTYYYKRRRFQCLVVRAALGDLLGPFPSCTC